MNIEKRLQLESLHKILWKDNGTRIGGRVPHTDPYLKEVPINTYRFWGYPTQKVFQGASSVLENCFMFVAGGFASYVVGKKRDYNDINVFCVVDDVNLAYHNVKFKMWLMALEDHSDIGVLIENKNNHKKYKSLNIAAQYGDKVQFLFVKKANGTDSMSSAILQVLSGFDISNCRVALIPHSRFGSRGTIETNDNWMIIQLDVDELDKIVTLSRDCKKKYDKELEAAGRLVHCRRFRTWGQYTMRAKRLAEADKAKKMNERYIGWIQRLRNGRISNTKTILNPPSLMECALAASMQRK
jgi:hypothetical protein